jgi:hypothetical protein
MKAVGREACPPCPKTGPYMRRTVALPRGGGLSKSQCLRSLSQKTRLTCGVSALLSQARDTRNSGTGPTARFGYTRVSTVSRSWISRTLPSKRRA